MLQVRHVVRNGKMMLFFVLVTGKRRCLPGLASRHASSLKSSSSAGSTKKSTSLSDGKLPKRAGSGKVPTAESPPTRNNTGSSCASTNANNVTRRSSEERREMVVVEMKNVKQRVQELVSQFTQGTKVLWSDFKGWRRAKARKQAGEPLTFHENRQLRQVGRDLAKALPVLTVFSLPIAGYLAPAIGYIFPKTMLPPQFWSSPQRLRFMLEDARKQEASSFPKLLQHLAMMASSPRPNSSPQHLRLSAEWFWRDGSLERLTREHLLRLVKACNTVPPLKKAAARFAPKSSLVSWLSTEAASISNDDLAIRKQFSDEAKKTISGQGEESKLNLTAAEVLVLCWERGLLRSQHWPNAQLRWAEHDRSGSSDGGACASVEPIPEAEAKAMLSSLKDYLSLYDTPRASGNLRGRSLDNSAIEGSAMMSSCGTTGAALPPSMVLHAPALLRMTQSANNGSAFPLCHLRVERATR